VIASSQICAETKVGSTERLKQESSKPLKTEKSLGLDKICGEKLTVDSTLNADIWYTKMKMPLKSSSFWCKIYQTSGKFSFCETGND
jgi:uncharacterized lipoprotein NlpE involved in copper resistance